METPEDIFSMDLKHLPPESAADDKGKIMVMVDNLDGELLI